MKEAGENRSVRGMDRKAGAIVIADGDEAARALAAAALTRAGYEIREVTAGVAVLDALRQSEAVLVARVRRFVNRKIARREVSGAEHRRPQLTLREIEFLNLLVEGRRQKEI